MEYATTLGNLSSVLSNLGDYKGAIEGYQKALEIKKKYYGENHVKYATTLGCLAEVLRYLGHFELAKTNC